MEDARESRETVSHSGRLSVNTGEFAWRIMILFNNRLGSGSRYNIRLPEDTEKKAVILDTPVHSVQNRVVCPAWR